MKTKKSFFFAICTCLALPIGLTQCKKDKRNIVCAIPAIVLVLSQQWRVLGINIIRQTVATC